MFSRLTVFLISLFILFFTSLSPAFSKMISITGDKINARSGPGQQFKVKWQYGNGFPLRVLDSEGDWFRVEDFEGDTSWVYKPLTTNKGHMIVKVNKSRKGTINLRTGPGRKYEVVAQAYYGVVFTTVEQRNGWAKVQHDSGVTGWIKRSLLWGY